MKHIRIIALSLLLAARAGIATAQTQTTSKQVDKTASKQENKSDSITWNKELEGIVVKAQRQLIKQEIDRIGYDVQADEESKTQTVMDMLRKQLKLQNLQERPSRPQSDEECQGGAEVDARLNGEAHRGDYRPRSP